MSTRAPRRSRPRGLLAGAAVAAAALAAGGCSGSSTAPGGSPSGARTSAGSAATSSGVPQRLTSFPVGWHLAQPVSRPATAVNGGQVLLLGGLATGDVSTAAVDAVDPVGGTSNVVGTLAAPVHDAAGAWLGGQAYVFGGGTASSVATVQSWHAGTGALVGQLPQARSDVAAAVVGGRAYVLGGYTGSALVTTVVATRDGQHFVADGELAQPVRYPAVTTRNGMIWVIGGLLNTTESNAGTQTTDIQRYDPSNGRTVVVGHLPVALAHAAAFVLDGGLYVAGGMANGAPQSTIYRIDPASGAVSVAGALPGPRADAGVATDGHRAWLLGGELSDPASPLDSVVEITAGSAG